MVASRRSWWRIAADITTTTRPVIPRKSTTSKGTGARAKPVVAADGPGQVWAWDITDLKGPYIRVMYKAYSVIDIFSRKIVAWRVEEREDKTLVTEMFEQALASHGRPHTVHADNGPSMKSDDLKYVLADHGVDMTHSRPSVSNDNPYSESEFRTMKYRPNYPGTFDDLDQAREFMAEYVPWYNAFHKHSGVGLFSPQEVHDGSWTTNWSIRDQALQDYYDQHSERFHHRPVTPLPPGLVGINHKDPSTDSKQLDN